MKDPYIVLGMESDSPFEQLKEKYTELKAKYSEDRFLQGEPGNTAARNLSDLEDAWLAILSEQKKNEAKKEFGGDYGYIDNLIKEGKYDEAQGLLDAIAQRSAQWHYLQSIIYYKREWMTECKAQLTMAVNMEPFNDKYKAALEKLEVIMGNPKTDPKVLGVDPSQERPMNGNEGQMCGNSCSTCCLAYCLTDCCCSLMQCM